jgi:hypothetical protein
MELFSRRFSKGGGTPLVAVAFSGTNLLLTHCFREERKTTSQLITYRFEPIIWLFLGRLFGFRSLDYSQMCIVSGHHF